MPNNDIDPQELLDSINGVSNANHSDMDPVEDSVRNNNNDSYYEAIKAGFKGGIGQMMSNTTKAMQALGKPSYKTDEEWQSEQTPLAQTIIATGESIKEDNQKQYDPYSGKWYLNAGAATAPLMAELLLTTAALTRTGNMQYAGNATQLGSQLLGAGPMAATVAGAFVPAATVGLATQFPESALEGQDAYEDSIKKGYPPEKAEEIRQAVIKANVGLLTGTNTIENLLTFGNLPFKIPSSVVGKFLKRAAVISAKTGTVAGTEGFEEAAQQIIPKIVTDEDWHWTDEDVKQAAALGAVTGVVFHGLGSGINNIADYHARKNATSESNADSLSDDLNSVINQQSPSDTPTPSAIQLPIADGVEDYAGVNENVKQGANNFGLYLQSIGIDPIITSGKRSAENNTAIGGAENSHHLSGNAVDIGLGDITSEQQAEIKAKAQEAGWGEVLYHDAGTGLHLHLADFRGNLGQNNTHYSENPLLAESGDLKGIINDAAKEYNLSPELIAAVMKHQKMEKQVPLDAPINAQEDVKKDESATTIQGDEKSSNNTTSNAIIPNHTISEGVHSRTNTPIWIVRLIDKADRAAYTAINATMRNLGGYFSSLRGVNGFVFNENPAVKLGDVAKNSQVKLMNDDKIKPVTASTAQKAFHNSTTTQNEKIVTVPLPKGNAGRSNETTNTGNVSDREDPFAEGSSKAKDPYNRPSNYRKGVRDKAWSNAEVESPDGVVRDPKTRTELNKDEPWDMGHKEGYEDRKHRESGRKRNLTRKEYLDEHNNPDIYRPELPSSNRSHTEEAPDDINYWP